MTNNNLTVLKNEGKVATIDSREVAEMMGKTHSELLKEIEGRSDGKNIGIITVLTKGKFHLVDYFIESSYKDKKGENRKCYFITKKGCELLGSKQQGEKGILFSIKYVEKFNEMEEALKDSQFKLPTTYKEALLQLVDQVEKNELLESQNKVLNEENNLLAGEVLEWADESIINALVRKCGGCDGEKYGENWNVWKREMLYKYSINVNARFEKDKEKATNKSKVRMLSTLRTKEELSNGLRVAVAMCRDRELDITKELGKHVGEI